jgi:integrase
MPTVKLTDRTIKALRAPERGQIDYFDANPRGFGVRVSQSARRAFFVMYRVGGRLRRFTLGTYPHLTLAAARQRAKDALHEAAHGNDPAGDKQADRRAETFGELADEYLTTHAKPNKRSWREDERILNHDLLPAWRTRKAKTITRRDVWALLKRISEERKSPIMANRTLALTRRIFGFAFEREIVPANPCSKMKPPAAEHERERVLSDDELRALWKALPSTRPWFQIVFKLYLLTAQRRDEVLGMTRAELDLDSGWWTLPSARSKNSLVHRVPLSPYVVDLLSEWVAATPDSNWVFPSPTRDAPLATLQKPLGLLRDATAIDFRIHDLRRTASTNMTKIRIDREAVARVLNHAPKDVTRIYDRHTYDQEKREALERWAQALLSIVEPPGTTEASASSGSPAGTTSDDLHGYLH